VVEWLKDAPNFEWRNFSVPSLEACVETTHKGLEDCLTHQISPAQGVIILAGMYAAHSHWIDYEITEALRLGKTIIGVRPWNLETTPVKIQNAADTMVNWQQSSIVEAIRLWV
jgi:hypothetical protein